MGNSRISSLSKTLRLVNVLQKCNGKESSSESGALISQKAIRILAAAGIILGAGLLFLAAFLIQPFIGSIISVKEIVLSLMLIMALVSFMIAIKNIITVLYTADDLSSLIPMPISDAMIVASKLIVASRFSVIISLVVIYSLGLGMGIRAGYGFTFILGTLLAGIIVPVVSVGLALALVVTVFRIFGAIRNRDVVVVLGSVFSLLIVGVYMVINSRLNGNESAQAAASAFTMLAAAASNIPHMSGLSGFMFEGSFLMLLLALGITAAVLALDYLLVRLFYFSVALSVQNTSTSGKAVSSDQIAGYKSKGVLKSLFSADLRSVKRNPSYLVYGFGMTFIWPLLLILPALSGSNTIASYIAPPYPFDLFKLLCEAIFVAVTASGFASSLNILAATSITREGDNIRMLKTMPIDYRTYLKSKRNTSLMIVSLGSVAYIFIMAVAALIVGLCTFSQLWVFLISAAVCFALNVIWTDLALLRNVRKPVLDWDTETEFTRKMGLVNYLCIAFGFVGYMGMMLFSIFYNSIAEEGAVGDMTVQTVIVAVLSLLVSVLIAYLVNRMMLSKGEKYIDQLQ